MLTLRRRSSAPPAPLVLRKATRSAPRRPVDPEPEGKVALGKTPKGKAVYASGAESGRYTDEDHAHAGLLHARALAHHQAKALLHGNAAEDEDTNWTRSEEHHGEATRHRALADHHEDLARLHLTAAGLADTLDVDVSGDEARVQRTPVDPKKRAEAKRQLARRSHHDHPGGISASDRDAYATLGGKE